MTLSIVPTQRRALRRTRGAAALACALLLSVSFAQAPEDDEARARTIVEKADLVRFPSGGFEVDVSIVTKSADDSETRRYKVLSKGNENAIVMITEPASERGQIMLMKGRDLWIFMPNVSQPIRLPLSQRLTGQVANGDLARANFTGDYTPRLLRTEPVDGEPTHVLELTAVDRSVTYHRVLYWVRQANAWPHKAEFYAASGRLLKTAYYQKFAKLGGVVRPTRMVMHDALREGEQSILDYANLKPRDLPDRVFTKDYLKRLE